MIVIYKIMMERPEGSQVMSLNTNLLKTVRKMRNQYVCLSLSITHTTKKEKIQRFRLHLKNNRQLFWWLLKLRSMIKPHLKSCQLISKKRTWLEKERRKYYHNRLRLIQLKGNYVRQNKPRTLCLGPEQVGEGEKGRFQQPCPMHP